MDAPLDPSNANRYAYAADDPINGSDPTGRNYTQTTGTFCYYLCLSFGWARWLRTQDSDARLRFRCWLLGIGHEFQFDRLPLRRLDRRILVHSWSRRGRHRKCFERQHEPSADRLFCNRGAWRRS